MTLRRCRLVLAAALMLVAFAPFEVLAAGQGERCGGVAGIRCDAGTWCQLPDGRCNVPDLQGTCVRTGTVCTMEYRPVCGCDGKTYGNACHLRIAHVQKRTDGACQ